MDILADTIIDKSFDAWSTFIPLQHFYTASIPIRVVYLLSFLGVSNQISETLGRQTLSLSVNQRQHRRILQHGSNYSIEEAGDCWGSYCLRSCISKSTNISLFKLSFLESIEISTSSCLSDLIYFAPWTIRWFTQTRTLCRFDLLSSLLIYTY